MKMRLALLVLATVLIGWVQEAYAFYNPSTGRWLSRDPMEEEGGINVYGFVSNEPVRKADRLGLLCCCCCAEDILIRNILPYPGAQSTGHIFGHTFDAMIKLKYVRSLRNKDCTLEWWESSNSTKPGESFAPTDMMKDPNHKPGFRAWWETKRPCPGLVVIPEHDEPTISTLIQQRRVLTFYIVVKSAPGCPCQWRTVSVTAKQTLKVGEHNQIETQEFKPGQTQGD